MKINFLHKQINIKYLIENIKGNFSGETIFLHGGKDKAVQYGYNDSFNFNKKFKNY